MKYSKDPRHQSRRILLNYAYSLYQNNNAPDLHYIISILEIHKYDEKLLNKLIKGYARHNIECEKLLLPLLNTWNKDQLLDLDIIILKISIIEFFYLKITPTKVAVDEAIELCKEFGTDKSSKFVNGVLAKFIEQNCKQ